MYSVGFGGEFLELFVKSEEDGLRGEHIVNLGGDGAHIFFSLIPVEVDFAIGKPFLDLSNLLFGKTFG